MVYKNKSESKYILWNQSYLNIEMEENNLYEFKGFQQEFGYQLYINLRLLKTYIESKLFMFGYK